MTITIVCGPPCAGKSWYVEQNLQLDEVVIDYDLIARELGSEREHLHRAEHREPAWLLYQSRISEAAAATCNVWIVRARPASSLLVDTVLAPVFAHAQVVELQAPVDVLVARARTRRHPRWQEDALRAWLKQWGGG